MTDLDFLSGNSEEVARKLIGYKIYVHTVDNIKVGGTIIETEAYRQFDKASHSYRGKTPRSEIMFGPSGRLYVYFTYGMHWCMNVVTGEDTVGEAVLIRSLLPEEGLSLIRKRRGNKSDALLTNGPAKVCQALGITGVHNGTKINENTVYLEEPDKAKVFKIEATKRIGIKHDMHRLWRFVAIPDEK